MRTGSMSSGTLLASRAAPPQSQQQQAIGSNSVVSNPAQSILGQLPTNPTLLKSAVGGQNATAAAKMFNANVAAAGSMLNNNNSSNHRGTPPSMSTFQQQFHPQQRAQTTTNPQQRIVGFGSGMDSPLNNDSDFPSLNTRSSPAPHSTAASNSLFGTGQPQFNLQSMSLYAKDALSSMQMQQRMPYANMMRGIVDSGYGQTAEFSLQPEDFPALGMQNSMNAASNGGNGSSVSNQLNSSESQLLNSGQTNSEAYSSIEKACNMALPQFGAHNFYNVPNMAASADFFSNGTNENGRESKLNISINGNNGVVSNIPAGMLCDQYGIVGLLTFMKGLDQYPGLSVLSVGLDITKLGLNLNSSGNLYQNFGGPWSEQPCRIQDYEAKVPDEYLTNSVIREKLPTIKVNKLSEDILFYLFYNCPGQVYQLAAATELYQRDWRYHKVDAVWLTRSIYGGMKEQTAEYETGSYNIFDPIQWRKVPKEMKLEYKMLEGKPVPANTPLGCPNLLNTNGSVTTPGQLPSTFPGTQQQQQSTNMAHFSSKNI